MTALLVAIPASVLGDGGSAGGGLDLTTFLQILHGGLTTGSVLGLVALGYNVVFSSTRIVNFAQGTMLVVGGYVAFWFVEERGLPIYLAFLGAVLATLTIGMLVHLVAIRSLGKIDVASTMGWILTTSAAGTILLDLVRLTVSSEAQSIPSLAGSIFGWDGSVVSGVAIVPEDVLIVFTALALMVGFEVLLSRTLVGKAFRAVSQDKQAATLMGIDANRMVMLSFAIAGALAAIAAVVLSQRLFVKLDNGLNLGVMAFVAAVIGGLGSTRGAIVGGYVIAFATAMTRALVTDGGQWEIPVVVAVFLAVLVLRPRGIFGEAVAEKV